MGICKSKERIGLDNINYQGCLMKIIEYNSSDDMYVVFQDKYNARVHCAWREFQEGGVTNPYYPSVYGVGIVGDKYKTKIGTEHTREYTIWNGILKRCFSVSEKEKHPTYIDVTCCDEWLYYENFYEWLHGQENFQQWYQNKQWAVDKDILFKGNKIYSPETCTLVPPRVNNVFINSKKARGDCPIGVHKRTDMNADVYRVFCNNSNGTSTRLGQYKTPEKAFEVYKKYKESVIKRVATEEYELGNITKACYDAMMAYEVEITD